MAEISKIKLPSGTEYDIKDAVARAAIEAITGGDAVVFIGVSSTAITDGGTQVPTIAGSDIDSISDLRAGDIVFYKAANEPNKEFIWDGSKWQMFDAAGTLGALAYKDDVSASYTPAGTVSQPTFTGSSSTVTITATDNTSGNYQPKGTVSQPTFTGSSLTSTGSFTPEGSVTVSTNATTNKTATVAPANSGDATYTPAGSVAAPTISVKTAGSTNNTLKPVTAKTVVNALSAAAPGATAPSGSVTYYSVADETLSLYQLGVTTTDSVTLGSAVTVKTGDAAYEATAPAFTGTGVRLVTGNIAVPSSYTASFEGSSGSISVSGTPSGTVSQPTFTGTKAQISGTTTASGTISQPTFSGTEATITSS